MDDNSLRRGRQNGSKPTSTAKTPEVRACRYCRAKFDVDPKHPNKEFCKDSHRKLAHRYGALSIGKIAERTIRDARKMIEAEVAPLRTRVEALEQRNRPPATHSGIEYMAPEDHPGNNRGDRSERSA